jgi:catechol 2,3-dioxygenase-like lactoylglutathione lyase family enzyme
MTTQFNHIAIRVADVPATVDRYRSLYDCRTVYISPIGSEPGCAALCELPGGALIELFEAGQGFAGHGCGSLGLIHHALSVDDVDEAFRAALAAGGTEVRPPTDNELDLFPGIVFRTAFYREQDGEVVELMTHNWSDALFEGAIPDLPPPTVRRG